MFKKSFHWNAAFYYALGRQDEKVIRRLPGVVVAHEFAEAYVLSDKPMHELYKEMESA